MLTVNMRGVATTRLKPADRKRASVRMRSVPCAKKRGVSHVAVFFGGWECFVWAVGGGNVGMEDLILLSACLVVNQYQLR